MPGLASAEAHRPSTLPTWRLLHPEALWCTREPPPYHPSDPARTANAIRARATTSHCSCPKRAPL